MVQSLRGTIPMAQKSTLNPKVYQSAVRYKAVLEDSGIEVASLYIFGSQAKGKAKKWSDIDIGVVSPDFSGDRFEDRGILMDYSHEIDDFIEPHPFTLEDFDDKYYTLAQEVKRTGIKI